METDLKKIVGHRLQMLRMEKNLTQEQMGEKLNLSTSAYCKIEYGETDLTLTRLNKIAEVLNMSALELFNKIDGNVYVNNTGTIGTNIGVAKDCTFLILVRYCFHVWSSVSAFITIRLPYFLPFSSIRSAEALEIINS